MPILEVRNLEKSYRIPRSLRWRKVVGGVSFQVEPGEVVGLLGPNGAGKTTCFRMACGLAAPDRGQVFLNGVDVTRWPMHVRAKEGGMGYLAQESSVFRSLSVEENLLGIMEMLDIPRRERIDRCDQLLEQFKITHIRKSKAGSLSGGERRRLEIARSLISDPDIILLDEPFAGVDPVTVQSIQEIISDLRDDGIAILITDHHVRETLQITQRSYVIRSGTVLCHGRPDEVLSHPEARRDYFGRDLEVRASA
ncbi:MAG: LPS export ABC transporter ATP-binding protein [Planctomycetes bacterium]|nr:LPS export ABC transporter ATP-binding protein [Planctomycetota bacterium]